MSLFNEVNEALGPYKAFEKRLVFFNILYIILEIEDIIGTIPLLISCFITWVSNFTRILVFMLLQSSRVVEILESVDKKYQKV